MYLLQEMREFTIPQCFFLYCQTYLTYYDQTCYIKNNIAQNRESSIFENIENIVLDILLPKSKPITVGYIYTPLIKQ